MIPSSHLLDEHAQALSLAEIRCLGQRDELRPDVHEIEQAPQDGRGALRSGHLLGEATSGIVSFRERGEDWFVFVCSRPGHQFASSKRLDPDDLIAVCPHCAVELEERDGRLRYAHLTFRLQVEG